MKRWLLAGILGLMGVQAQAAPDYYTLAVSLSPAFCELNPGKAAGSRQCREGFALIVHGLWPEAYRGRPPEDCERGAPRLSPQVQRAAEAVMPDAGLRRHEWSKHGSCSGLTADAYFSLLNKEYKEVQWPALLTDTRGRDKVVERRLVLDALKKANPGLPERGVYLRCQGKGRPPLLSEVRICLTAQGEFTECAATFKPNCPAALTIKGR